MICNQNSIYNEQITVEIPKQHQLSKDVDGVKSNND